MAVEPDVERDGREELHRALLGSFHRFKFTRAAPRAFAQGLIRALFQIRFNADGDYHHWRFSHLRLIHGRPS
jgi:hypothetical protein